ncbi:MAG: DNA polymerase III subunit alpha, partial [Clostridia bacterium]|nr:DNA polymerase III subunit alpha [Clostridia bacterium]
KGDKTNRYVPGAVANGVSEEIASTLFEQMLKFASYAFNKSHATAYTFLTYQTGWLKCYYPIHFLVAIINNRISDAKELTHYINYMKRKGIKILAPDINISKEYFSIDHDNVRYGLMGIKNVGKEAMKFVLNERNENGPFKDIKDFLERTSGQVNKRMVESLIKSGAFDFTGKTRATLMASYESIMNVVANDKKNGMGGQMSLFDDLIEDVEIQYTELEEYPRDQILMNEKEMLGMYVSGHPLDEYPENKGEFNFATTDIFVENEGINEETDTAEGEEEKAGMVVDTSIANKQVKFGCIVASSEKKSTKSGQRFAVGMLEDRVGTIQFAMYARAYEQYRDLLEKGVPIKVYEKV